MEKPNWTFFSNHAHVLLCIAADPVARVRDISEKVKITERAVQQIIHDLEESGYLSHVKDGRRNHYTVHMDKTLRHPVEKHCKVSELADLILKGM